MLPGCESLRILKLLSGINLAERCPVSRLAIHLTLAIVKLQTGGEGEISLSDDSLISTFFTLLTDRNIEQ